MPKTSRTSSCSRPTPPTHSTSSRSNRWRLDRDGVITLQYALKRAIENVFQIESSELARCFDGTAGQPNIFLYEAAEGSLGILSQFAEDATVFHRVIDEAIRLLRYDDPEYLDPASYDDLLSYYNQRDHLIINRFLIQDALNKLKMCRLERQTNTRLRRLRRALPVASRAT